MSSVLPGVADVLASLLTPHKVLMSDDFPTLDLPMKANSCNLAFGLSLNFSLLPAKTAFVIFISQILMQMY